VINRGLAADPHDRGSAAAFALDLRHACRPEPVRLPSEDVPDGDLGRTGRGPRTELTHQVPGHRARPAPVIAATPGRRERWRMALQERTGLQARSLAVRGAIVAVAAAGLLATGWLGVRWAGEMGSSPDVAAGTVVAAEVSALPGQATGTGSADQEGAPAPEPVGDSGTVPAPGSVADTGKAPDMVEGWRAVVAELYQRRAGAFASASTEGLADVYAPGSPLRVADEEHVRALSEAGEVLRGFGPTVVAVTATNGDGDRVDLDLVDHWSDYEVVPVGAPHGHAIRAVPGRPESAVRMVLVRTAEGWRIESAHRRP
jgi:hypothetical protein